MNNSIKSIKYKNNKAIINLVIDSLPQKTNQMPKTVGVLESYLPSIFTNQCFNGKGLTFRQEVKNTETAHLFEHLILEEMCLEKLKYASSAVFGGRTLWNRSKNNGRYTIELSFSLADWPIFTHALLKSIELINIIARKHYIN